MHGNYDGLADRLPVIFDLHVGVNFWSTVNVTDAGFAQIVEGIVFVPDNFVQVCLVNTGSGTPFISGLDLRPFNKELYEQVNATQGLVLYARINFGGPDDSTSVPDEGAYGSSSLKTSTKKDSSIVRYPDDPYDRIWESWFDQPDWVVISTKKSVKNVNNGDPFEAPTVVMQTAITPNTSKNIEISGVMAEPLSTPGYIAILYFSELQVLPSNAVRKFSINLNGRPWYASDYKPEYLQAKAIYSTEPLPLQNPQYNKSISSTADSTLSPIINAFEVYSVISTANVGTDAQDEKMISKAMKPQNESSINDGYGHGSLKLENRRFAYKELEMITNNFERVLGRGGFGYVYDGFLEDGTQVAVKLRSQSSNQGVKEFLAEENT
uniref:Malectin-like domain-containing protein n=1 Tax=Leersia perrieri TaxID=77586 RepID=A0A0D9X7K6_9ORYZ